MLRLTMTDKLHYQDVFQTINIPKTERRLALRAKNLFDIAMGVEQWDPSIHEHMRKAIDNENASQVFWEFDDNDEKTHDLLVLTMMKRSLTIGLEYRDFKTTMLPYRKSLHLENGISNVYTSGVRAGNGLGSSAETDVAAFKQVFFERAAHLGLYRQAVLLHTDQNESNSAIFARAA